MLRWVLIFLVVAIIAGILGFSGIAGAAAEIAKIKRTNLKKYRITIRIADYLLLKSAARLPHCSKPDKFIDVVPK